MPLHGFDQNKIWTAIMMLALEVTAWMQILALTGHDAHWWEPKRLRLRLFTIPAVLTRRARRQMLHLAEHPPWANVVHDGLHRLRGPRAGAWLTTSPTRPDDPPHHPDLWNPRTDRRRTRPHTHLQESRPKHGISAAITLLRSPNKDRG